MRRAVPIQEGAYGRMGKENVRATNAGRRSFVLADDLVEVEELLLAEDLGAVAHALSRLAEAGHLLEELLGGHRLGGGLELFHAELKEEVREGPLNGEGQKYNASFTADRFS